MPSELLCFFSVKSLTGNGGRNCSGGSCASSALNTARGLRRRITMTARDSQGLALQHNQAPRGHFCRCRQIGSDCRALTAVALQPPELRRQLWRRRADLQCEASRPSRWGTGLWRNTRQKRRKIILPNLLLRCLYKSWYHQEEGIWLNFPVFIPSILWPSEWSSSLSGNLVLLPCWGLLRRAPTYRACKLAPFFRVRVFWLCLPAGWWRQPCKPRSSKKPEIFTSGKLLQPHPTAGALTVGMIRK